MSDTERIPPHPFEPPLGAPIQTAERSLGSGFWVPIILCFGVSVVLLYSSSMTFYSSSMTFFGIVCLISTSFATVRGLLYQTRSRQAFELEVPYKRGPGFEIFFASMFLGVVATIASGIAFQVICLSASSFRMSFPQSEMGLILCALFCGVCALFLGVVFVRSTVPKLPDPTVGTSLSVEKPRVNDDFR